MKHTYYHTCHHCGAHLDPGERCDCQREASDTMLDAPAALSAHYAGQQNKKAAFGLLHTSKNAGKKHICGKMCGIIK